MKRLPVLIATALLSLTPLLAVSPREPQNDRSAALLFRTQCSSCHGRDGQAETARGKTNHARNLADPAWQDDVSDERIFNSIMNGRNVRGKMPSFGKRITEKEAESLVIYVRGLRK